MNKQFKKVLLDLVRNESEELIELWISLFDEGEKDEQYRYYDDFLGFFEECVEADLDLKSPQAQALMHFLEKLIEIQGEDKFFNFKDSVYTCYLKFPILKKLDEKGLFEYENIKNLTVFFEGLTSSLIIKLLKKNMEMQTTAMNELEVREAPISHIWNNTIMVSIVGTLDSDRVLKIIDKILQRLDKSEIEYVVVDIGSIYDVNSEVARQLIKLNNAIHFMGATAYLTGITPSIAKSLTHLEINLGDIKTFSTTQKAMEFIINV
ncbi:MAG: STAS domain-containing protein [Epsilonproteobacteria bacterium]|nr:STAS domain-containing protein [Campylobacterota bacterium]